jgi:hypothetical protein
MHTAEQFDHTLGDQRAIGTDKNVALLVGRLRKTSPKPTGVCIDALPRWWPLPCWLSKKSPRAWSGSKIGTHGLAGHRAACAE